MGVAVALLIGLINHIDNENMLKTQRELSERQIVINQSLNLINGEFNKLKAENAEFGNLTAKFSNFSKIAMGKTIIETSENDSCFSITNKNRTIGTLYGDCSDFLTGDSSTAEK